jgi:hypothetical protein
MDKYDGIKVRRTFLQRKSKSESVNGTECQSRLTNKNLCNFQLYNLATVEWKSIGEFGSITAKGGDW